MLYKHVPYKKRETAIRAGKTTLSVAIALIICTNAPVLRDNMEVSIPVVSGVLRIIDNILKQKFSFDISSFIS